MKNLETLINELCPEGVEFVKLGDVFELFSGMSKVSNKWAETGNCKFIDYLNIYNNLNVDVNKLQNATVASFKQNVLKQGDILFTCASETPRECAISAVIREPIADNTFLDDHLNGIRVKKEVKDKVNPAFVNYYFYSPNFRIAICKIVRGVTRFYIVNKNFLKIEIPLPPIEVQTEIVRILDKFTSLQAELEAELEAELDCRKRQYEYYRDKLLSFENVGGQNVEWKKMSEICLNCDSKRKAITSSKREAGKIPYYGASGIVDYVRDYIFDGNYLLVSEDGANLLARNTPIAFSITGKNWVNNHAHVLKFDNINTQKFVEYYLNSISLSPWISGAAQPKLNQENLNKMKLPIPSLAEQERIVSILDRFESLTTSLTAGLPAEIAARRQQYEHYRDKLLTFKRKSA